MSTAAIPPTPPPAAQASPAAQAPVLTVAVSSTAQALAEMPAGALVLATLDAVESGGLVSVTTESGTSLELRLPPTLSLPADAELSLQITQQNGSPALKLLAVNSQPLPGIGAAGLAALAQAANTDPTQLLGQGKTANAQAVAGQPGPGAETQAPQLVGAKAAAFASLGLTATVLRPAGTENVMAGGPGATALAAGQAPPNLTGLAVGTQITVRVAGIIPPPGEAQPGTLLVQPQAGAAQPAGTPSAQPTHPQPDQQQPQQQQQPGQQNGQSPGEGGRTAAQPGIPFKPAIPAGPGAGQGTIQPTLIPGEGQAGAMPSSPAQSSASSAPAQTMSGVILSRSIGGTAVIQTPAGVLSLPNGPPAAAGSRLILEVIGQPQPPAPDQIGPQVPQGLSEKGWPSLDQAVETLARTEPQVLDQLIRAIPQANPHLAAALSLFSRAVRGGEFRLLGADGALRGLDRAGRRDLAERLRKDFEALVDDAGRPRGDGDWRAITLPFAHGSQVDPVRLYVQRIRGDDPSRSGGRGQEHRFILEVQMSRLGRIQLDGLVQKETKRFDLIVRTDLPLDAEMRRDISGIFAESAQLTGIKGSVGFQAGRGFTELPPTDGKGTRIVV